jgi:hypothetical protein
MPIGGRSKYALDLYPIPILICKGSGDSGSDFSRLTISLALLETRVDRLREGMFMSKALPREVEQYVDPASSINSLRRLLDAVEAGEIDMSAMAAYAKTAAKGEAPTFRVTAPIPLIMLKMIAAHPDKTPRQVIYGNGLQTGLWTDKDVENWEMNDSALHDARKEANRRADRGVYRTRTLVPRTRRPKINNMFTAKVSHEALSRSGLSDGARQCLLWLVTLAGKQDTLTTYTTSIATLMERTSRTVRNYFIALEEAGLITRRPASHYNTVHITLHPDCRPPKYEEPRDVKAFKMARKSQNPGLHLMAMSVVLASVDAHPETFTTLDRRKGISVFNQESNTLMQRLTENPLLPQQTPPKKRLGNEELSAPTTHSTLLLDPSRPVNGEKLWKGRHMWTRPSGFNHLSAR